MTKTLAQDVACFMQKWKLNNYKKNLENAVEISVDKAYRDATIRATRGDKAKVLEKKNGYSFGKKYLIEKLLGFCNAPPIDFDKWHEDTCRYLVDTCFADFNKKYKFDSAASFVIGNAQKWLNISFKNLFCFICTYKFTNDSGAILKRNNFDICHLPVDGIILNDFKKREIHINANWSRLNDYDDYLNFQKAVRKHFANNASLYPGYNSLLELDFFIWRQKGDKII